MKQTNENATSRQEVKMSKIGLKFVVEDLNDLYAKIDEQSANIQELGKKYGIDRLAKVVEDLESALDDVNDALVEAEATDDEI